MQFKWYMNCIQNITYLIRMTMAMAIRFLVQNSIIMLVFKKVNSEIVKKKRKRSCIKLLQNKNIQN